MAKKLGIKKKDLEDLFAEFDTDGSGKIDSAELQEFAANVGIFWDAEQIEQAVKDMDENGDGEIEIAEFAKWFLKNQAGEASDELKMKMKAKLVLRTISKALGKVKADAKGMECKNVFAGSCGKTHVTPEDCKAMAKMFVCGSSPEEFASLNGPEDGKIAMHVDFSLKEGHSDDDFATLKEGLQQAFDMFVAPMIEMIPPPPKIPGLKEGRIYESHAIEKVCVDGKDVLRFIVYSSVDPASLYRDTGLTIGEFIPTIHYAAYSSSGVADLFNRDRDFKLGDMAARVEYSIVWNTKILHAVAAMLEQPMVQNGLETMARFNKPKLASVGMNMIATMFKKQRTSVEIKFNGLEEALRTGIFEFCLPSFAATQQRRRKYSDCSQKDDIMNKAGLDPNEEKLEEFIAAICNLSGKTPATIGDAIINFGPVIPVFMFQSSCSIIPRPARPFVQQSLRPNSLVSPLFAVKVIQ
jgi:hypothetical protein